MPTFLTVFSRPSGTAAAGFTDNVHYLAMLHRLEAHGDDTATLAVSPS